MAEFEKTSIDETINNFIKYTQGKKYKTIYADPPWQFQNRTGKVAPEHKRLNRYPTMKLEDIMKLPVGDVADEKKPFVFMGAECTASGRIAGNGSVGV